jgi:hypothetical protein
MKKSGLELAVTTAVASVFIALGAAALGVFVGIAAVAARFIWSL